MNILLAIPTSILGTFIVIYFLGFTLNTYTVLGLTLVVGIVVDDAIMVLENIYRHREMGEGKVKAASVGAREITFAAAATTLAIVAIFLPVAFLKGIIGKFFFQFGVTISVAVLISLLEALTLAPMRCSQFLEVEHRGPARADGGRALHEALRALPAGARARSSATGAGSSLGSLAFFLLSLGTIGLLRQEFIPSQDMSRFTIRFQTPVGTSLDATDRYFRQIETFLMSRPEVTLFAGSVGGGSDVNSGQAYVNMKEPRERPVDPEKGRRLTQLEFMDVVRKFATSVPGGRIVPAGHLADRLQPLARAAASRSSSTSAAGTGTSSPAPRARSPSRCGSRASSPTSTPTTRWGCRRSRSSPTGTGPRTSG